MRSSGSGASPRLLRGYSSLFDSDIGRPVEDIAFPLGDNRLVRASRRVLDNLIPVEQEAQTTEGRWDSLRIPPYLTMDNSWSGGVSCPVVG
jgi:hypothetical protein